MNPEEKVSQYDLERYRRLLNRLEEARKKPSGPTWEDKDTVERNVHPALLRIVNELLDYRATPPAALAATGVSGGAPLSPQRITEIETTWGATIQKPLGVKDSDALYRVQVPELLAGYRALAELVAKHRLTQPLQAQSVAAAIHDGLRITDEPADLARIVIAALAASPASVTSPQNTLKAIDSVLAWWGEDSYIAQSDQECAVEELRQLRATIAAASVTSPVEPAAAKSALVNDAERKYLGEVFDCLPDSMSDFLADFMRRLTPRAALTSYVGGATDAPTPPPVGRT